MSRLRTFSLNSTQLLFCLAPVRHKGFRGKEVDICGKSDEYKDVCNNKANAAAATTNNITIMVIIMIKLMITVIISVIKERNNDNHKNCKSIHDMFTKL